MTTFHILLPIVVFVAVAFTVFKVADFLEDRGHKQQHAVTSIRRAALWEFGFGYLLILFSVGSYLAMLSEKPSIAYHLVGMIGGVVWVCLARVLRRGGRRFRIVFLWLSIMRVASVLGIPFSIATVLLLYATKDARTYYSASTSASGSPQSLPHFHKQPTQNKSKPISTK